MMLFTSRVAIFKAIALLAFAMVSGACSQSPSFVAGPVLEPNPNPAVPLAAVLEFEASAPVTALIEVTDGEHKWQLEYGPEHDPSAGLPVVGMRPDRRHEIRVAIRLAAGAEVSSPTVLEFQTPALPEAGVDFPPIEVAVSKPGEMEPGVTLFNPRRRRVGRGQDVAEFNAAFGWAIHGFQPPLSTTPAPDGPWARYN